MPTAGTEIVKLRWLSVAATLMLHVGILFVVVVLPPLAFDVISSSSLRNIQGLEFSGGVTYPLYATYWVGKLKSFRAKFMLFHLIFLLSIVFGTAIASNQSTPLAIAWLPTVVATLPLLGAVASWLRRIRVLGTTYLLSSLLALPIGVLSSLLIMYGMAVRSSLSGLRY